MNARIESQRKREQKENTCRTFDETAGCKSNPNACDGSGPQKSRNSEINKDPRATQLSHFKQPPVEQEKSRYLGSDDELGKQDCMKDDFDDNENSAAKKYTIRVGLESMRGHRSHNDDCARVDVESNCYAISDGIGGAPDGDFMSRVSCGALIDEYRHTGDLLKAFLAGAAAAAQVSKWIDNPDCGATLLAASISNGSFRAIWAGDSVAYRLRDLQLTLLTSPDRIGNTNALGSAIGHEEEPAHFSVECDVRPGDRFLLCTDGVWETYVNKLGLTRLARHLSQSPNAPMAARMICEEASQVGDDNSTAIMLIVAEDNQDLDFEEQRMVTLPLLTPHYREDKHNVSPDSFMTMEHQTSENEAGE